jgi:hypothetical protein
VFLCSLCPIFADSVPDLSLALASHRIESTLTLSVDRSNTPFGDVRVGQEQSERGAEVDTSGPFRLQRRRQGKAPYVRDAIESRRPREDCSTS